MSLSDQLIIHGAINGLLAALAGIPYGKSILQKKVDAERAWKLVHSSGSMGAILMIAIASILDRFKAPYLEIIYFSVLICGYGFMIGMLIAAQSGERGLKRGGSISNTFINTAYRSTALATIAAFSAIVLGILTN